MVSIAAVESLKKAEDLKEITSNLQKMDYNCNIWPAQQQLQKIYHDVLILDLEYALDKKVEQDLWNYCFKNYIASLQSSAKDKKVNGIHVQNRLSWFLDCASGFYLSLLQEICSVFNLDLPFMRADSLFGFKRYVNENSVINRPERSSCYYICQHCLVHLGDVARYRNQTIQAESFYRHAVELGPSSGHPYNQLALLEATRSDRLSTVFYYVRSIAVSHRFPAAITNLASTLSKSHKFELPGCESGKMSATEYEACFLHFHALLYPSPSRPQDLPPQGGGAGAAAAAEGVLRALNQSLTPLIATQEFSPWRLVQMLVITMFMYCETDDQVISRLHSEYLIGFLNALLVPVYTMSPEAALDYFALPTVKVILSWMKCEPTCLTALNRSHLWRGLTKLLNLLRSSHPTTTAGVGLAPPASGSSITGMTSALPEDVDLQGFLPFDAEFASLSFSGEPLNADAAKKLRAFRLIKFGEWLSMNSELKPILISENGEFEVAQFPSSPGSPARQEQSTTHLSKPQSRSSPLSQGPTHQENWKGRSRQNVALQSLLKKPKSQASESIMGISPALEWHEKGQYGTAGGGGGGWWPAPHQGAGTKDEGGQSQNWTSQDLLVSSSGHLQLHRGKAEGTYSLFSGGTSDLNPQLSSGGNSLLQAAGSTCSAVPIANHQSLWSGPGPSPLERLLEQQKQMRSSAASSPPAALSAASPLDYDT